MPVSSDPTYQPITEDDGWFAGEDQGLQWYISDVTGAVQNLTGFTMQFKMALTKTGTSIYTKTVTSPSPTIGLASMTSASADTSSIAPGTYYYAVRRTDAGNVAALAHGPVVLQGLPT